MKAVGGRPKPSRPLARAPGRLYRRTRRYCGTVYVPVPGQPPLEPTSSANKTSGARSSGQPSASRPLRLSLNVHFPESNAKISLSETMFSSCKAELLVPVTEHEPQ